MDGNGRWANRLGKSRVNGHRKGVETVRNVVEWCGELGVHCVTLFAFSSENWNRPAKEVSVLMDLLANTLVKDTQTMHERGIQIRFIGDDSKLNAKLRNQMAKSAAITKDNQKLILTLAINYGGRWDIVNAAQQAIKLAAVGELNNDELDESRFSSLLSNSDLPDPDLLIRTSGEYRISNFLLWQLAYSEFYFTDVHWPEFDRAELEKAFSVYAKRDRRFGGAIDNPIRAHVK